jgi:hypothetical protein
MPHGRSHIQNVSARTRWVGGWADERNRPKQRSENFVHLQIMAKVEFVKNKIPRKF